MFRAGNRQWSGAGVQDDAGAFVEGKLMASQRDLASLISVTL
ncbi:MAG: hypothetical protein JWP20_2916 [Roseomonas sp.]|nr:hypothetical protein [Roseomonas sp.]